MPPIEGIVKSSESLKVEPVFHGPMSDLPTYMQEGVPIDIYRYFKVDLTNTNDVKKLRDISEWAFKDTESIGDGLEKLSSIDRKLGNICNVGETKINKLWNWITLQRRIEDLQKRQGAISG